VIETMRAGLPVEAIHGQRGKQRSVHNTYFTLPVLIAMLSNHYGWLTQARHNWLVLTLLMLTGALIRHSFVARHKARTQGRRVPWEYAVTGVALLAGLVAWLAPAPQPASRAAAGPVDITEIQVIAERRCVPCHNGELQQKNVALHTPQLLRRHALGVYQQASVLKLMPLNNATQMTDEERALIGRWYEAGAQERQR
jgi:uncharacterized membrane protein